MLYAGNAAPRARIEITYKEKGVEKPTRVNRDLTRIEATGRRRCGPWSASERERDRDAREPQGRREARARRRWLDGLARSTRPGCTRRQLSYEHVGRVGSRWPADAHAARASSTPGRRRPSNVRTSSEKPTLPLVTWDHVISPDEAEEIVGKLAAFPGSQSLQGGQSYRGRDISVMEITLPTTSEQVSVTK